ncbi:hypothetical protein ACWGI1_00075 [Streptomyces sp. NPDC054835]|uniref:hypothetical protein n=1 Tax=Streptomyces exfoliatus TaxID=1905 RepID=UPI000463FC04|nr:hypothetical protein [Streptomyces exfoliatus]
MTATRRASSRDTVLQEVFGASLEELHMQAVRPEASPALFRALELREYLAVAEQMVVRVRDRVHESTAPEGSMDLLSAETLALDAKWMDAALAGRNRCVSALDQLLSAMPPPSSRPVPATPLAVKSSLPVAPPTGADALGVPAARH